jgi:hypothetical protein
MASANCQQGIRPGVVIAVPGWTLTALFAAVLACFFCQQVKKLNDCIGEEVEKAVKDAKDGEVRHRASRLTLGGLLKGQAHICCQFKQPAVPCSSCTLLNWQALNSGACI